MKQFFLVGALLGALSSSAAAQDATVYIGHGINGTDLALTEELPVDVTVNGSVLLAGFEFRSFTDGLVLPEGPYRIEIGVADPVNPGSQPALIDVTVDLFSGENATILAYLDGTGGLTAGKFLNNTSKSPRLSGYVSAAHTAFAPAVDLRLGRVNESGGGILRGVTNGVSAGQFLNAGLFGIDVVAAGTKTRVLGPLFLPVLPQTNTAIFVVGSLSNGTLEALTLAY